jgi:hypothetical protein
MTFQPEQITYHGAPEFDDGFLLKPSSGAGLSLASTRFVEALAKALEARETLNERVRTIPDNVDDLNARAARYQDELVNYIRACDEVNRELVRTAEYR